MVFFLLIFMSACRKLNFEEKKFEMIDTCVIKITLMIFYRKER